MTSIVRLTSTFAPSANGGGSERVRELRQRLTSACGLAGALGLKVGPRASARTAMICCPAHEDRNPSCSLWIAKDGTLAAKCHSCGWAADALGLIAQVRGTDDFREVLSIAADIANAPHLGPEVAKVRAPEREGLSDATYHDVWSWILGELSPMREVSPHVAAYVGTRRVFADADASDVRGYPADSREFARRLLENFDEAHLDGILCHGSVEWPQWPVCIPWRDRFGLITFVQRRCVEGKAPKYRSPFGRSPRGPYGIHLLRDALAFGGPDAEVVICEGAFASLARRKIARLSNERVAVLGIYSATAPCVGLPEDLLEGRRVVLSLDADRAGEKAREALVGALEHVAAALVHERATGGAVDAGDLLEAM